ncbi:17-beta-hydroxysteroid dehydrogenase type 6-like [Leptodactylus fuscus]|uniref:17-beta-hydroxysteroid dehydrogenase type 6-like n=1 Tax=Leptodactylus fuscus TaxID=238119 RepID=UPI003F4EEC2E
MWLLLPVVFALILLYRWYKQSLMLENVTDKYVFITGCDTGFGNLLAKQLDKRGMKVLAACLTDHGAKNLKKETSSRLQTILLDVTDSKSVRSAAEIVSNTVGKTDYTEYYSNSLGPEKGFCYFVFISVAASVHVLCLCFIRSPVRRELRDFGVKVSIIEPGGFQTPMMLSGDVHINSLKRVWENLPKEVKDSYGKQYYEQYEKNLKALFNTASPKTYQVPDCMEHALTAVYPWTRYSLGWDCKLIYLPLSYLPTVLSDYVMARFSPKPANKAEQSTTTCG